MKHRYWVWIVLLICAPALAIQWEWNDPESADSYVVDLTDDGLLMAVGTSDRGAPPQWNDYGPGAWVALFETSSNLPIASYCLGSNDFWVSDIAVAENGRTVAALYSRELVVLDGEGLLLWRRSLGAFWGQFENLEMDLNGEVIAAMTYYDHSGQTGPDLYVFHRDSPDEFLYFAMGGGGLLGRGVSISADGRFVAAAVIENMSNPAIYFFDLESAVPEQPAWVWNGTGLNAACLAVDMSRDGSTVVAVANSRIMYFDTSIPVGDKEPLWVGYGSGIGSLSQEVHLAYDGSALVYASEYSDMGGVHNWGTVELWSGEGERVWLYEHAIGATCVEISGDGSQVAYGGSARIQFDPETGLIPAALGEPVYIWPEPSNQVAIDWDGNRMASASGFVSDYGVRGFSSTFLHAPEVNAAPDCLILAPQAGSPVAGVIEVSGQADDEDGAVVRVEVGAPAGWVQASDTSGGGFATWSCALDLASVPDGPQQIVAQAVDERGKHSELQSVAVTVGNPTPAPTYTPPPWLTGTPTVPPQPSATPTPTPPGEQPAYRLELNRSRFAAGDVFLCSLAIENDGPDCWVIECVVLAAGGEFFFYPEWTRQPDWVVRYAPAGSRYYESIVAFEVPPGAGPGGPYEFMAGLADPESAELIGIISTVSFWFE